ncbi:hypothetical protein T492DRAFT_1002586 [Pavlovales sp. CCMP2436]|nr:hypothetical protein T492DRAFT_1002586 [Pavlovales sp. CCMP2436]
MRVGVAISLLAALAVPAAALRSASLLEDLFAHAESPDCRLRGGDGDGPLSAIATPAVLARWNRSTFSSDCLVQLAFRLWPNRARAAALYDYVMNPEAVAQIGGALPPPARARWKSCAVTSGLPAKEHDAGRIGRLIDETDGPIIRPNALCVQASVRGWQQKLAATARSKPEPWRRTVAVDLRRYHSRSIDITLINSHLPARCNCHSQLSVAGLLVVYIPQFAHGLTELVRCADTMRAARTTQAAAWHADPPQGGVNEFVDAPVSYALASPSLLRLGTALVLSHSARNPKHRFASAAPSTGLLSIAFALLHCEEVRLFGFAGPAKVRGHAMWWGHDVEAERSVVRSLTATDGVETGRMIWLAMASQLGINASVKVYY